MDKELNYLLTEAARAGERGSPLGAAALYGRALKRDPRSYRAWVGLAVSYADMGLPAKAEKAARKALTLDPGIAHAWQILSELRLKAGDPAGARDLAARASLANPASHIPDYVSALIRLRGGDRRGARKYLEAALAKEPAFTPAHAELIGLAAAARDAAGLLKAAAKAVRDCPPAGLRQLLGALRQALLTGPARPWALAAAGRLEARLASVLSERGGALPADFSRELAARRAGKDSREKARPPDAPGRSYRAARRKKESPL